MKKINTLTIIGLGLIGGSIARRAKKEKLAREIIGFSRRKSTLNKALREKAIDRATVSFGKAVSDADVIVVATPVSLIPIFLKRCQAHCKSGCLIVDVGSTKEKIVRRAEKIFSQDKFFVGTHPMAGSEKKGFEFSRAGLFNNSICFLTRTKKTKPQALKKIKLFWKQLGAKPVVISPEKHDRVVSEISHLPHVVAVSLLNCARSNIKFIGNGFKDTTRVASSDSNIWIDIFLSNRINVIKSIDKFIKNLRYIRGRIKGKRKAELRRILEKAKSVRDSLI